MKKVKKTYRAARLEIPTKCVVTLHIVLQRKT